MVLTVKRAVLLIERGPPDALALVWALTATFGARGSHPLPPSLPPPEHWESKSAGMAREEGLAAVDCGEAFESLRRFWHSQGLGGERGDSAEG